MKRCLLMLSLDALQVDDMCVKANSLEYYVFQLDVERNEIMHEGYYPGT